VTSTTCTVSSASDQLHIFANFSADYTPETRYIHLDMLGSVRAITNAAGTSTLENHDYRPFGEDSTTLPAAGNDHTRFIGAERDGTKLDHMGAREFDMFRGRFTGVDPHISSFAIGNPQRWNRYSYASNNPPRYVDPSGMDQDIWGTCVNPKPDSERDTGICANSDLETPASPLSQGIYSDSFQAFVNSILANNDGGLCPTCKVSTTPPKGGGSISDPQNSQSPCNAECKQKQDDELKKTSLDILTKAAQIKPGQQQSTLATLAQDTQNFSSNFEYYTSYSINEGYGYFMPVGEGGWNTASIPTSPSTVATIHTHGPNKDPWPNGDDLNSPILSITVSAKGAWAYSPETGNVVQVLTSAQLNSLIRSK